MQGHGLRPTGGVPNILGGLGPPHSYRTEYPVGTQGLGAPLSARLELVTVPSLG